MTTTDDAPEFRDQLPATAGDAGPELVAAPALPAPELPRDVFAGDPTPAAGPSLRELAEDVSPEEAEEAGLPGQTIHVEFEPGSGLDPITVRTVNKDYLRWDKTPAARRGGVRNFQDAPFLFATFLAWAGAKREGLTQLTFDQFQELAEQVERRAAHEVPPTQ